MQLLSPKSRMTPCTPLAQGEGLAQHPGREKGCMGAIAVQALSVKAQAMALQLFQTQSA